MKHRFLGLFCLVVTLTSGGCSISDQEAQALALFDQSNNQYGEGRTDDALTGYLSLLEQGHRSGPLLYNIGNCYYRKGRIGKAIVFYERALELMPGDEDVEHNLDLARLKVTDEITPIPEFWLLRLWRRAVLLPPAVLVNGFLAAAWLGFMASLILRLLGPSGWRRWMALTARFLACLCLAGLLLLGSRWWIEDRTTEAVVIVEKVRAFGSPGSGSEEVFALHEGTKVRIDETRGNWHEIVLADGKHGWIEADAVEII